MLEWWNNISAFEKTFWYFAVPFTVILSIQFILTFLGFDGVETDIDDLDDLDAIDDADFMAGFRLFTLRNFIIFFTGFGWAGICAIHAGLNEIITIIVAFLVGLFLMFAVAFIFFLMTKLTEKGNVTLSNALNAFGQVYLPIPPNRSGVGKVQIIIQGSLREVEAMTDGELLPTCTPIKVTEVVNAGLLIVSKNQ